MAVVMIHLPLALVLTALAAAPAWSQSAPPPGTRPASRPAVVAEDVELASVTLVKSGDGTAVVRAGGALHVVTVGARLGRSKATVTEIAPGRLVVEEVARTSEGRPVRAYVMWRDGDTGGRRFTRQNETKAPVGLRPDVVAPAARPASTGTKKPGSR
jgi:hypothetical protein